MEMADNVGVSVASVHSAGLAEPGLGRNRLGPMGSKRAQPEEVSRERGP